MGAPTNGVCLYLALLCCNLPMLPTSDKTGEAGCCNCGKMGWDPGPHVAMGWDSAKVVMGPVAEPVAPLLIAAA